METQKRELSSLMSQAISHLAHIENLTVSIVDARKKRMALQSPIHAPTPERPQYTEKLVENDTP
jgi:hypothetical protein